METNSKEDRIAAGAAPPPQAILPSYHLVGGGVSIGDQELQLCPFLWLLATSELSCGNSGDASCFLSLSRQEGKEFCLM